jgi:hypothetical protein
VSPPASRSRPRSSNPPPPLPPLRSAEGTKVLLPQRDSVSAREGPPASSKSSVPRRLPPNPPPPPPRPRSLSRSSKPPA